MIPIDSRMETALLPGQDDSPLSQTFLLLQAYLYDPPSLDATESCFNILHYTTWPCKTPWSSPLLPNPALIQSFEHTPALMNVMKKMKSDASA